MLDEPEGDVYYGGDVAAPVFANVAEQALRLLNVKPDKTIKLAIGSEKKESNRG